MRRRRVESEEEREREREKGRRYLEPSEEQEKKKKGADLSRASSVALPLCGTSGIACVPGALLMFTRLSLRAESDEEASIVCRSAVGKERKLSTVDEMPSSLSFLMALYKPILTSAAGRCRGATAPPTPAEGRTRMSA